MPKRIGYLAEKIYSIENIQFADKNARKGKKSKYGVIKHDKHREEHILAIHDMLKSGTMKVSPYRLETIKEYSGNKLKERVLKKLPYYPDRIVQWSIMNVLVPIWDKLFIKQTYACIIGRGIHKCAKDVQKVLRDDPEGTKYCLQLDIKKYYDNVDHDILFKILQKKIKDKLVLSWLKEIIDSADGIPIGSFTSQYFSNIYLTYFDHHVKEVLRVKHYFRYADNIVIFAKTKEELHVVFNVIRDYLSKLKLTVKEDWQIYPVDARGVDFVGYVFRHKYTKLRKCIKVRAMKMIRMDIPNLRMHISSYFGWMKYANTKHLLHKIEHITGIAFSNWIGTKTTFRKVANKSVKLIHVEERKKYSLIQFILKNRPYYIVSRDFKRCLELKFLEGSSVILAYR